MNTADRIRERAAILPEPAQREVLDFVEYLLAKAEAEDREWSTFSLASAMRGMEEEAWPDYSSDDYSETWK